MTIDLHIHLHTTSSAFERRVLDSLEKLMKNAADLEKSIADINTATDTVAAEITDLKARIVPGISQADADAIGDQLDAVATRLKSIGSPDAPAGNVPPTASTPPATT